MEYRPHDVKPKLGSIASLYSHSIGENLAIGHTYWQGRVGNVVLSLVAMCQLKFAVEKGRTNFEGLLFYNIPNVFFVCNRSIAMLSVFWSQSELLSVTLPHSRI